MVENNQEPTTALKPLSFNAKLGIGGFAFAILYMLFAPYLSSPPSPQKQENLAATTSPKHTGGWYVPTGTQVQMIATAPGCSKLENLTKFRALATEHDRDAVSRMVDQGDCEIIEKGTYVTAEDTSVWKSAECVRKAGETDCLWTLVAATNGEKK